jgi:hypothetical protein
LLFVTLLPASSALLGRFPDSFVAIAVFALDVILIQLTALWLWQHASRYKLVNPELDSRVVLGVARRLRFSALVFAISIPLVLLSPYVVYLTWIGVYALILTTDWLSWQQAVKTSQAAIPLDGAERASIQMKHSAGRLYILPTPIGEGLINGVFGGGVDTQINRSGHYIEVQMTQPKARGFMSFVFPWAWGQANIRDWNCRLTGEIPVALNIESASGEANLELVSMQLTELNLKINVSALNVALPARPGLMKVYIQARTASIFITTPPEAAVSIHSNQPLVNATINLERFPEVSKGLEYRSVDYDQASNQVEIRLDLATSSVRIA